jgi:hypothetical protein
VTGTSGTIRIDDEGGSEVAINRTRLGTYLNDHLAGSTTGLELAKRTASQNKGTEYAAFLQRLVDEIAEDRETLREMIRALGFREDPVKKLVAWSGEKVGRLKPNGQLLGYSPLSRLLELEGLTVGVTGKRSMWVNLQPVQAHDERLAQFDLVELQARAERQLAGLEEQRVRAAIPALTEAG